jgi:hypothetical protein
MSSRSLEEMRAERDRLDAKIRAAEENAVLEHNSRMAELEGALRAFALDDGNWPVKNRRRKNAELLDIGFGDQVVTVALYLHEPDYPVGSTVVSVTDQASGVTATFDGAPSGQALVALVKGWLVSSVEEES